MGALCPTNKALVNTSWTQSISFQDNREEFDDDTMDFSVKSILITPSENVSFGFSDIQSMSTTSYTSSLCQIVKFRIGNRLMCMSWNLWHDYESTPFDYYWNIWSLQLFDEDRALIDTLWDVARVFFELDNPTDLCRTTELNMVVPSLLLSPNVLEKFCNSANLSLDERKKIMKLSHSSLFNFLSEWSGDAVERVFHHEANLSRAHFRRRIRDSSPFQPTYEIASFQQLIEEDVLLLPALLLDALHVFVIRFSTYLLGRQQTKVFSEYESHVQIEKFGGFRTETIPDNLYIPKLFTRMRARLYKKWKRVFEDRNIIRQIWNKARKRAADIILLQRVKEGTFQELVKQLSDVYTIVPSIFPEGKNEATIICLLKSTVTHRNKIRRIDEHNFAVLCRTSDIFYYIGVVNLDDSEDSSLLRRKIVARLMKYIGTTKPAIIGGDFGEDLAVTGNPLARTMLRSYNGINHNQEVPLASVVNLNRSLLNFKIERTSVQIKSVTNGIFSSFPLVGDAFSDLVSWGPNNPSDHAPIFQEIMLGLFRVSGGS